MSPYSLDFYFFFGFFVKVSVVLNFIIQFKLIVLCFQFNPHCFDFYFIFFSFLYKLLLFLISPFNYNNVFIFYINFDPYSFFLLLN
jgi:hypothetical protein